MNRAAEQGQHDRPRKLAGISRQERAVVRALFREQARTFSGYWGAMTLGHARTFWIRARYDAHATMRGAL